MSYRDHIFAKVFLLHVGLDMSEKYLRSTRPTLFDDYNPPV